MHVELYFFSTTPEKTEFGGFGRKNILRQAFSGFRVKVRMHSAFSSPNVSYSFESLRQLVLQSCVKLQVAAALRAIEAESPIGRSAPGTLLLAADAADPNRCCDPTKYPPLNGQSSITSEADVFLSLQILF